MSGKETTKEVEERMFTSSSAYPGYPGFECRSGQSVEIVRRIPANEFDEAEVGPMYRVRFSDGVETDAFEEELSTRKAGQ
jgi:hypothetical protein